MHDHREAVEVLDINIADRALCDAAGVEEAGLGRDNDGVGPRGNAGIAHAGFQIAVPVGFAQSLTADDLVHARRPKPTIDDGAHNRLLARGANEAADDAAVGSSVIRRADAHQMEDMLGAANHAHPIAGEEPALRVADEDDLVRTGGHAHGADIGVELLGGFGQGLGGAVSVVRGEDGPAVLAQFIAEDLPYALGIAGAVDEDDRPGSLRSRTRAPVIFEDAARFDARAKGQGGGGISIERGIAWAGLALLGFDEVRDFGRDLLAQCRGLGRGGDAATRGIGQFLLVGTPEFAELFGNSGFQLSHGSGLYPLLQVNCVFIRGEEIYGQTLDHPTKGL